MTPPRHTATRLAALGLLAALTLSACSSTPSDSGSTPGADSAAGASSPDGAADTGTPAPDEGAPPNQGEATTVLTSFYPLEFLATRIAQGSETVTVESVAPSGAEPHDLELAPAQVVDIGEADLLIYLSGFQPAIDDAVAVVGPNALDIASAVRLEAFDAAEHDHAEDESHDHGEADPHFWLDPQRMADAAEAISAALSEQAPTQAATFEANNAALQAELADLDAAFTEGLAQCRTRTLVTSHDAFGYLAERYGLETVGISGIDPEGEPSPARLREVAGVVEATGTTTIFTESLISARAAEVLAQDLGVTTALLDPVEAITTESPGTDYLSVMTANLTALRSGLECS